MVISTKNRSKKYGWLAVRFLGSLAVLFFVGWKIMNIVGNEDWNLAVAGSFSWWPILVALVLVFANWGIEATKWQQLMRENYVLSFKEALKGVLAGLSTGILTPNRIGNFIGRVALLPNEIRMTGILHTLLGNMAQFIVSLGFGLLGFLVLVLSSSEIMSLWLPFSAAWLVIPSLVLIGLSCWFYAFPKRLDIFPFNRVFKKDEIKNLADLNTHQPKLKWKIVFLSGIRYLVFVTQFVLVIWAFGGSEPLKLSFGVMSIYLLMTIIPSLFFGKLFLREAAALIILPIFGMTDSVIIICGFMMWLLNIALPASFGTLFFFRKK